MRFSVDAHSVGCHLTGNEVYIRNLLNEFARIDRSNQFIAYVAKPQAPSSLPQRIETRWVSENPYRRLAVDLPQPCAPRPARFTARAVHRADVYQCAVGGQHP